MLSGICCYLPVYSLEEDGNKLRPLHDLSWKLICSTEGYIHVRGSFDDIYCLHNLSYGLYSVIMAPVAPIVCFLIVDLSSVCMVGVGGLREDVFSFFLVNPQGAYSSLDEFCLLG